MPPFVSTILRMAGRGGDISDNFNRSLTGSLGLMSTGAMPWTVATGIWDVNGTRPVTATSLASNPHATVNTGLANLEAQLTLGAGDALYFRVQDASNWWRVLWEGYQTSVCDTCCSTCCSTCCNSCPGNYIQCNDCGNSNSCTNPAVVNCSSTCAGCPTTNCHQEACSFSCNCYSCNCVSCNCVSCNCVYYDNYRMLLQKNIAGTVTTVATGAVVATTTTRAKVILDGSTVSAYYGSTGQTSLYSGTQAQLAAATKHGIGRGASAYNVSALDDFRLIWK